MSSRVRRRSGVPLLPLLFCCVPATLVAQTTPPPVSPPPSGSLIVDPQQGATPRPITPLPQPTPTPLPVTPPTSQPVRPADGPVITLQPLRGGQPNVTEPQTLPRAPGSTLPAPSRNPLAIDPKADPILRLALPGTDATAFRSAIRSVVERNPTLAEAEARRDEVRANRNEARAGQYPVVDLSYTHFQVLKREFSNDPQNILERSRPRERTDAILRLQQPLFDFGTTRSRISAGNRRLEAATAAIDDSSAQIAMRGIAAWYQVFGYRALVRLSTSFVEGQRALRGAIQTRIDQGYSAPGDIAQVESYIAAAEAQLAGYRRSLASAEAQYEALTGSPPPRELGRAPADDSAPVSEARARSDAETIPAVRSARLTAEASRYDARTAKSNMLPGLTVGVDAGRYGVFQNERDYDIRGNVTFSARFGGGAAQRLDASEARARGAEAAYLRTRDDAMRDAAIAWADVKALEESEAAIRDNYLATRQSRDVLAERFRVARGTLFDLLAAETNYFNVAARYVETVTELDISRYALLTRRGKLLDTFAIEPARMDARND